MKVTFGTEILGLEKNAIRERIEFTINPTNLSGLSFFENKLDETSKDSVIAYIADMEFDSFYIEHTRGIIEKLYLAPKAILLNILEERIIPERRQGLDLTILPSDFSCAFMTNHDGGVFSVTM